MAKNSWITNFTALRFFLGGIEIYIIAPTAWYYVSSLGQTKFFLSLVFTAYNVGAIIAGPLFGYLTDKFGNPRLMFNCCCVLKIVANLIYSINLSPYFPLFGRLMTGLSGDIAILLGQVALQTDEEKRGENFVFLEGIYCLGSVFGPAIGSFISFKTNILGWNIDEGNSPGIVLAIIYLVFLIASIFLPKEIWVKSETRDSTLSDNDKEKLKAAWKERGSEWTVSRVEESSCTVWDSRIFCLLFVIFSSEVFSSTSTFYAPILALDHLHLRLIHVKLLFLNCTLFTLTLFIVLHLASTYVEERKLLVLALSMEIIGISLLALLAFYWNDVSDIQYYILLLYVCLGMPYFANPYGNSILSKITNSKHATLVQGISLATVHSAIAICRVAVSFAFTKTSLIWYCFSMMFLWLTSVIWYGLLYQRMVPKDNTE